MKIVSNHAGICFFILVNLALWTMSSVGVSATSHVKKNECHLDMSSYRSYNNGVSKEIEILLYAFDLSAAKLVGDLTAILDESTNFTIINTKVASVLFETLTRESGIESLRPALVSFIGIDGVSFSYFTGGEGGTFAVYSNDTLSSSSYAWYTQSVSSTEAGKLAGEVKIDDSPAASANAEFFLQAVSMKNGYTSIGRRWCSESETEMLVIRTVFVEQLKGAVSLGFPIGDNADLISGRMCREVDRENAMFVPKTKEKVKASYISSISIAVVVPFVVSVYSTAYSIQLARKKRELNTELTKYKKVAEEAESKTVNKSAAVATASHDIRGSLACIISLIELSYRTVVRGSEVETNLRQMDTCAKDLLGLLSSILDASKIEAGKMILEESNFDLSKFLEDVVDLYHPVAMKKGVDVVLDPCDGSLYEYPIVKGDRIKLKQVLSNLLSNAVKFTAEGHVSIRAWARKHIVEHSSVNGARRNTSSNSSLSFWKPKKMVDPDNDESTNMIKQDPNCVEYVFEIDDTGKGIPKDKWKAVFENFVQVKKTDAATGTGLGLGIVKSLVQLMGGDIEVVEKPFYQRGTCFRFNVFLANFPGHTNGFPSKIVPNEDSNTESPYSDDGHSGCVSSNIPKASLVLLLIQNEGRREMIQRFLESIGVMVVQVKEAKDLPSILEKPNSIPDNALQSPISSALLIIDASAGNFSELKDYVETSKKELSMKTHCSVVWLETRGSGEGGNAIPWADYVTSKPLHGCRLFEVIKLLRGQLILNSPDQKAKSPLSNDPIPSFDPYLVGKKVLIVEDNPMLMLVATKIVTNMGGVAEECHNGQEAVDHLSASYLNQLFEGSDKPPYDYILMDCKMPVLDGFEATRMIREEESEYGVHIPIIALTAHETGEELKRTFEVGMDYVLQKPLEEESLMVAVKFIERQNMIKKLQEE